MFVNRRAHCSLKLLVCTNGVSIKVFSSLCLSPFLATTSFIKVAPMHLPSVDEMVNPIEAKIRSPLKANMSISNTALELNHRLSRLQTAKKESEMNDSILQVTTLSLRIYFVDRLADQTKSYSCNLNERASEVHRWKCK